MESTPPLTATTPLDTTVAAGEVAPVPESVPVNPGGVATLWREVEPDPALTDRVPHTITQYISCNTGWTLVGASRRGKMHAHRGNFREDAFALGALNGWHILVVADGGGSCPLSRAGSQLAVDTAVESITNMLSTNMERFQMGQSTGATDFRECSAPAPPDRTATHPTDEGDRNHLESLQAVEQLCTHALLAGLESAWRALFDEARRRAVPLQHLGTTFLTLLHYPTPEGHVVGALQVGDGLIVTQLVNGEVLCLTEPDVGETAGVTLFLTGRLWDDWRDRARVQILPAAPRLLAAMCDGVADDFIPFDSHLPKLFDALQQVLAQEAPEAVLLELLSYERRGSFDDRTLVLCYAMRNPPEIDP